MILFLNFNWNCEKDEHSATNNSNGQILEKSYELEGKRSGWIFKFVTATKQS